MRFLEVKFTSCVLLAVLFSAHLEALLDIGSESKSKESSALLSACIQIAAGDSKCHDKLKEVAPGSSDLHIRTSTASIKKETVGQINGMESTLPPIRNESVTPNLSQDPSKGTITLKSGGGGDDNDDADISTRSDPTPATELTSKGNAFLTTLSFKKSTPLQSELAETSSSVAGTEKAPTVDDFEVKDQGISISDLDDPYNFDSATDLITTDRVGLWATTRILVQRTTVDAPSSSKTVSAQTSDLVDVRSSTLATKLISSDSTRESQIQFSTVPTQSTTEDGQGFEQTTPHASVTSDGSRTLDIRGPTSTAAVLSSVSTSTMWTIPWATSTNGETSQLGTSAPLSSSSKVNTVITDLTQKTFEPISRTSVAKDFITDSSAVTDSTTASKGSEFTTKFNIEKTTAVHSERAKTNSSVAGTEKVTTSVDHSEGKVQTSTAGTLTSGLKDITTTDLHNPNRVSSATVPFTTDHVRVWATTRISVQRTTFDQALSSKTVSEENSNPADVRSSTSATRLISSDSTRSQVLLSTVSTPSTTERHSPMTSATVENEGSHTTHIRGSSPTAILTSSISSSTTQALSSMTPTQRESGHLMIRIPSSSPKSNTVITDYAQKTTEPISKTAVTKESNTISMSESTHIVSVTASSPSDSEYENPREGHHDVTATGSATPQSTKQFAQSTSRRTENYDAVTYSNQRLSVTQSTTHKAQTDIKTNVRQTTVTMNTGSRCGHDCVKDTTNDKLVTTEVYDSERDTDDVGYSDDAFAITYLRPRPYIPPRGSRIWPKICQSRARFHVKAATAGRYPNSCLYLDRNRPHHRKPVPPQAYRPLGYFLSPPMHPSAPQQNTKHPNIHPDNDPLLTVNQNGFKPPLNSNGPNHSQTKNMPALSNSNFNNPPVPSSSVDFLPPSQLARAADYPRNHPDLPSGHQFRPQLHPVYETHLPRVPLQVYHEKYPESQQSQRTHSNGPYYGRPLKLAPNHHHQIFFEQLSAGFEREHVKQRVIHQNVHPPIVVNPFLPELTINKFFQNHDPLLPKEVLEAMEAMEKMSKHEGDSLKGAEFLDKLPLFR